MAGTVIVRLEPMKGSGNLTHDLGKRNELNYVDHTKSHLNMIVIGQPFQDSKAIFKRQQKFIIDDFNQSKESERQFLMPDFMDKDEYRKQRRNIRNWQSHMKSHRAGFIGFGHDAQANDLNHENLDRCAQKYLEDFCERHNVEVLYLVRHMDETTVHYHFVTTNYNSELKQTLHLKRDCLRKEQDRIGEAFSSMGLTRGMDKQERLKQTAKELKQPMQDGRYSAEVWKESNVIHRSVKQLHEDLPLEIAEKQKEADRIQSEIQKQQAKLEKNQKLIQKNESQLTRLNIQNASAEVKREKIEKRLGIYEKRVKDAQSEIDRLSIDFKEIKGTNIEYITSYEPKRFGSPKPIIKRANLVSAKKANQHYKTLKAKAIKLQEEQNQLELKKQQHLEQQQNSEAEIQLFFAKQAYKHMLVFGKAIDNSEELLDFIKWYDQESQWTTTKLGTRFKVQEKNGQVIRVVVENTVGKTDYEKAYTLLNAASKSKLNSGYFTGSDDVLIQVWNLMEEHRDKLNFELLLTKEQEMLLEKRNLMTHQIRDVEIGMT